ncbi:16S rRNA (cytidine(1402)-2'-O)-methyltransferase [Lentilitoribacter sp. EG35]|uniref:16S rRNA (cytidine(1402)-2'-O)-methyltransferase n=1 Tax=Lentilitoribacter sp. EG35 TaxID=3234192 RepID=UPI00345FCC63
MTNQNYTIATFKIDAKPIEPGLYIVATPIGNLGDITLRALETLAACDVIACEDTRTSSKLLNRFNIKTRTIAYHEHNAAFASEKMVAALDEGKTIALISDAGTPLISDPGYRIVNAASAAGHPVIPIPGASALLSALMGAGLPTDSFFYGGFLPHKEKAKRDRLTEVSRIEATLILYESPNRLLASLKTAEDVLGGDRLACVGRELTKSYEEFVRGTLSELVETFSERAIKGEIVLIIGPPTQSEVMSDDEVMGWLKELAHDLPTGKAASEAARLTNRPRKELYKILLDLKNKNP